MERNSSQSTVKGYTSSIKHLEEMTGKSIDELLEIAKSENKLDWEDTQLRSWLIQYRNMSYAKFKERSANTNLGRVKTFFRHYNIRLGELPYFSTKQVKKSEEIDYEDLPNREMLRKAIEMKNPLLKALTLFMSSTGISRTDTWNMTVQNYLDATYEYHQCDNIYDAIKQMDKSEVSIIPTFKLRRKKTGEVYRTFASPECVKAINNYLLSRDYVENEDQLFNMSFRYINSVFEDTNKLLGFGRINGRSRFSPQMLRSYHASQLSEAGMSDANIDLLQGRKPSSIARKSYIRVKREKLKSEYIRCLPYLVIDDVEEIKTELDVTKKQLDIVSSENTELKDNLNSIWDELNDIRKRQDIWDKL